MVWRSRRSFIVLLQGFSLGRRVALSLFLVRLILVPVIFVAVYYLFAMASIVDRIVNTDAPVARNAERASLEMLDARRAETTASANEALGSVGPRYRTDLDTSSGIGPLRE